MNRESRIGCLLFACIPERVCWARWVANITDALTMIFAIQSTIGIVTHGVTWIRLLRRLMTIGTLILTAVDTRVKKRGS